MEGLSMLVQGLINHFEPKMLFLMSVASILGITIGALPGLTATMGIALLSSITYGMDPKLAIPILVALYCGGIYGGSNSAILLNIPGTPSAAATAIDGYQLAQKGEAGPVIGLARVASTVGGIVGVVALVLATPLLAKLALKFGSWEFFVISVMGIMVCGSLTIGELPVKGWMTGFLGLLTAMIGMDVITSYQRFTFGNLHLNSGVSLIPALIGLFGMTEILTVMREPIQGELAVDPKELKVSIPIGELLKYWATTIRSALIGIAIGIIPGVGEDVAAWVSYGTAKNVGTEKDKIGYGSKEGVVAAEVANNACIGGASIPMLALAIPEAEQQQCSWEVYGCTA
jgi:putative tricarboxylic transport membrane protein